MTSLTTVRSRRGVRGLVAGSLALGLTASVLAVGAGSAQALVDPSPAWTNNPNLPASCGLDVMLVLDASKSIATAGATADVKAAANTLVQALKDTNTRVGITTFGRGPIGVQALVDDTADTAAASGALGAAIAAYTPDTVEGTNWEAGIRTASQLFTTAGKRAGVTQLMIVVTDGAPNYYLNADGVPVAGTSYPSASKDAKDEAMDRTNLFKAGGGSVLGIGVGSDFATAGATTRISYLEQLSQYAVQLTPGDPLADPPVAPTYAPVGRTSGPTNLTNPVTGLPYTAFDPATTDTLIQPDYVALGNSFKAIADNVCDSTLKITNLATTATSPLVYRNGGAGWASNVALDGAAVDWINPVAQDAVVAGDEDGTSNAAGTAVYQWYSAAGGWTRTATVTLTQKANYNLTALTCTKKNKGSNTVTPVAVTPVNGVFTVTVGGGQISCEVKSKYVGTPQASITIAPTSVVKVYPLTTQLLTGKLLKPSASVPGTFLPVAGKAVTIEALRAGTSTWVAVGRAGTTSTGAWALSVKPAYNTYYRASFAGMTGLLANRSANALERVSTKVAIKLNKNNIALGTTVVFSGAVAPYKRGQIVYLQALVAGKWKNIKTATLTSSSTYAIAWKPTSRIDYKWRVVKVSDTLNYTGVSPVLTLVVK
jgi:Mg-chelatase subunit ChlD